MNIAMLTAFEGMRNLAGGVGEHVRNLLKELREYRITVVALDEPGASDAGLPSHVRTLRVPRSPLPMTVSGPTVDAVRLARAVHRLHPDLVHAQMLGAPYGMAALLLVKAFPVVLTVHTTASQKRRFTRGLAGWIHDSVWGSLERLQVSGIHDFVAVSPNVQSELERMGAHRVTLAPNGVSEEWFRLDDRSVPGRVLFVGRLSPQKGLEYLIDAAGLLRDRGIAFDMHLLGPAENESYTDSLRERIVRRGLDDKVFVPARLVPEEDLRDAYSTCTIFALPSVEESHPIALLQAMAAGKGIVATAVGGVPGLLEDGEDAVLVRPRDAEALARGLESLLRDKARRREFGARARSRATGYTWAECARRSGMAYHAAIDGRRVR